MFKTILPQLLSFDIEWIPDPMAAELLYGIPHNPPYSLPDAFRVLWENAGATEDSPRPFVKLMLSRILTIAGIFRETKSDGSVSLRLVSLPSDVSDPEKCHEKAILRAFLRAIGTRRPQLVGFNSGNADVPILAQRAIVHGLDGEGFGTRPEKPWEGADYFSTHSDYHVDLCQALGAGRYAMKLDEAARLCGIPGKVDTAGDQVWELYLKGRLDQILAYNEFDAVTTHLLWARLAHFARLLDAKTYDQEQRLVRELLDREIAAGRDHFSRYLAEWDRLKALNERL